MLARGLKLWLCGILAVTAACQHGERGTAARATDLGGRPVSPFGSEPAVTVLVFVSPDCPISNRYVPTLRSLRQQHTPLGVRFWLVYPDQDVSAEQIRQHRQQFQLEMPALRDPAHELVALAKATKVPEAAVFVGDGRHPRLIYHGRIDDRFADYGVVRPRSTSHDLLHALQAAIAGDTRVLPSMPAVGCPIP
jgi:hypothetical protein